MKLNLKFLSKIFSYFSCAKKECGHNKMIDSASLEQEKNLVTKDDFEIYF